MCFSHNQCFIHENYASNTDWHWTKCPVHIIPMENYRHQKGRKQIKLQKGEKMTLNEFIYCSFKYLKYGSLKRFVHSIDDIKYIENLS